MINFKNEENELIQKNYPLIYKFIKNFLLRHKKELPKIIKVKIYNKVDYDIENTSLTSNIKRFEVIAPDYTLHINLIQLLNLYTGREKLSREAGKNIKGFRKFLLFVLYHELGHYNLKHHDNYDDYNFLKIIAENNCDSWALNKLLQGQLEFDF